MYCVTLKLDAPRPFEKSVNVSGHRHSPEGLNLQHYRCENSDLIRNIVEDDVVSAYRSFSIFRVEVG